MAAACAASGRGWQLSRPIRSCFAGIRLCRRRSRSRSRPAAPCAPFSSAFPILMRSALRLRTTRLPRARQKQWRHVDGDRPTRIRSHVETRARACEKWLPLWRIITNQDQVAELRTRVVLVRLANIERMKLMYRHELSNLPEAAADELLIALAVLTSFESWDQMRHCHGLSTDAAQGIWRSAIDRMLPSGR
jgi:hypothetical protein